MKYSRQIGVVAGLAISVVFLVLAFQGLNLPTLWRDIQTASLPLIVLGMAWYFTAVVLISARWQFLLRTLAPISLRQLVPLVCIGYMGNNVYPFRSGEILRLLLLQRNHGVPFARGGIITVAERMFDGIVMLSFVMAGLALLNLQSAWLTQIAALTAPLFAAALLVFFVLAARPDLFRRVAAWFARLLPARLGALVMRLTEDILRGLDGLRTPRDLAGAVVLSYLSWMFEASVYWIVAFAFNLGIDYPTALLIVGVVNLAGLIPASPGMVGVFQFAVISVLGLVGITGTNVAAYAVVVHVTIWLPVTVVGFILLARQGLNWGAVRRAQTLKETGNLNEGTIVVP